MSRLATISLGESQRESKGVCLRLRLEASTLLGGIIKFAVGVANLLSRNKQLEACGHSLLTKREMCGEPC